MTPFSDADGLIRGGGRLDKAHLTFGRKHPVLIPDCEEGDALLNHIHSTLAHHQGRIVTMAIVREEGYLCAYGRKEEDQPSYIILLEVPSTKS